MEHEKSKQNHACVLSSRTCAGALRDSDRLGGCFLARIDDGRIRIHFGSFGDLRSNSLLGSLRDLLGTRRYRSCKLAVRTPGIVSVVGAYCSRSTSVSVDSHQASWKS